MTGGIPGVPPGAAVKNSDTLWQYRKNFKFLKEVKILSEFFRNKFGCLIQIYVRVRRTPGIPPESWGKKIEKEVLCQ